LVAVLVGVVSLLVSGGARGVDTEHCARLEAQSQLREHQVTGHGEHVVVIGDSYSVGLGLRHPETAWPSRLPGRVQVFGFSGSGFSEHASTCPGASYADRAPDAIRGGAELVVVEGGLNDYDQPEADLRDGFRRLMTELRGHRVLVVGPPDAPSRAAAAERVDLLLRDESARARVDYLPMTGHPFAYLSDRLHLTPAGHREFGDLVAAAVRG
jgi:acyl-CoA thioesterase-1